MSSDVVVTDHVSLGVSDVSEDADGAAMRQAADHPLLHVQQQLLQNGGEIGSDPAPAVQGGSETSFRTWT